MLCGWMLGHIRAVVVKDEIIAIIYFLYKGCKGHITIRLMVAIDFTVCCSMDDWRLISVFDIQKGGVQGVCISQVVTEGDA